MRNLTIAVLVLLLGLVALLLLRDDEPLLPEPPGAPDQPWITTTNDPPPLAPDAKVAHRVVARLRPLGRFEVPAPAPTPALQVRDAHGNVLPCRVLADGGGDARLIRFELGGATHHRRVHVPAADTDPGLALGGELELRGRVTDIGGKPVAGAQVWAGASAADTRTTVRTDAKGMWNCTVPECGEVPVVVTADGHSSQLRWVGTANGPLDFVLEPGCDLTIDATLPAEMTGEVQILVLPSGTGDTRLLHHPWWLQWLDAPDRDEQGRLRCRGLPREVTVAVTALHPQLRLARPTPVTLSRARQLLELPLRAQPAVRGRVLDEHGNPLTGVEVRSWRAGEPFPRRADRHLMPDWTAAEGGAVTHTAADGTFAIAYRAGDELEVDAALRWRLRCAVRTPGALAVPLVLPRCTEPIAPPLLRLQPPGDGNWAVRVEPWLQTFTPVAAGTVFEQRLEQPALLAIELEWQPEGGARTVAAPQVRAVVGPVDVAFSR